MFWFNDIYYEWRQKSETTTTTDYWFLSKTHHTHTKTVTYWYLDDEWFKYAFNKIQLLLKYDWEYRSSLEKLGNKLEKMINKINKYINVFNVNLINISKKLSKNDIIKLQKYYDIEYIQSYESFIYKARSVVSKINELLMKNCRTKKWLHVIIESKKNIESFIEKVKQKKRELKMDIVAINLSQYKNPLIRFFRSIFLNLFY